MRHSARKRKCKDIVFFSPSQVMRISFFSYFPFFPFIFLLFSFFPSLWSCLKHHFGNSLPGEGMTIPVIRSTELCGKGKSLPSLSFFIKAMCRIFSVKYKLIAPYLIIFIVFLFLKPCCL